MPARPAKTPPPKATARTQARTQARARAGTPAVAASDDTPPAADSAIAAPPSGVLERGLAILECFSEDRLRLALRDLAGLTGLDKATLLRLLGVLQRARMVQRDEAGQYAPGPALLRLGMLYRRTFDLASRLQPVLREVMQQTGETVAFYVRSGDERVCLYRENSANEVRHHVEVGNRIPLAAGGASAHVLLACTGGQTRQLDTLVRDGYVITRGERVAQMSSVALPVIEGDATFLGAMVVIGLAARQSPAAQRQAVAVARRALAEQGFATQWAGLQGMSSAP